MLEIGHFRERGEASAGKVLARMKEREVVQFWKVREGAHALIGDFRAIGHEGFELRHGSQRFQASVIEAAAEVQGFQMGELLDLPVVGTGVLGSAMSINKLVAKKTLREAGIPTAEFLSCSYGEVIFSFEQIKTKK